MPGDSAYEVTLIPFPVLQPMSFKRNKYLEAIIGNKSFSQAGHLRTHMIIQTGKKVHKCAQCRESCGRAVSLKRHMLTPTGSGEKHLVSNEHNNLIFHG